MMKGYCLYDHSIKVRFYFLSEIAYIKKVASIKINQILVFTSIQAKMCFYES
jgi:hypothetical protein